MLTFNLPRVKALFMREFYLGYLPMLKASSILILVIYVVNLIGRIATDEERGDDDFSGAIIKFGLILLIGGFIYASVAFKEFRKVSTRGEFLALPGSSLEKITVKWFVTNPLFILTISLLILVCSTIFSPFIAKAGGEYYMNEIFFSREYWTLVGIYFIIHSIFFIGSIAFNSLALIKTLVALILIALSVALLSAIWFRIIYADQFESLFQIKQVVGSREFGVNHTSPDEMWQIQFFIFAFKYLLAPFMWVASLFKLSEKEV